jgi:tRNA-splicing ligase RtcB (3'-phosphate/5'-hydroxy nucleic acid ligase)
MIEIKGDKVDIKSWCNVPEKGAVDQAYNLSSLPIVYKHVALMPDTHQGYGMPIGGVVACDNAIIPGAVGVDIGCGMRAIKTNIKATEMNTETIQKILSFIKVAIPVGYKHRNKPLKWYKDSDLLLLRNVIHNNDIFDTMLKLITDESVHQIGTLGGGNHFQEIQKDECGNIWIMIHSGSRNFGYKVADLFCERALTTCIENNTFLPSYDKKNNLAYFDTESSLGQDYRACMDFCLYFASINRALMMSLWKNILEISRTEFETIQEIDVHHNYANMEEHFGKDVWVHRKGATSAKVDEWGIIPGSQGTTSYIVKGLGNPDSFMSCSHGAGRKMSRAKARKTLNLADEQRILNDKNILHAIRSENDLDEASSAYKDIDVVMAEQADLVKIVTKLEPIAVLKG